MPVRKKNKPPSFQFYPDKWLSSPQVALMSPEQEGAYIRLLCYDWDNDGLQDDDGQLARLSRLGEGWLKGSSTIIKECFIAHPKKPGFITNKRLLKERKKQKSWRKKCVAGGKKSGESRRKQGSSGDNKEVKGSSRVVEVKANTTTTSTTTTSNNNSTLSDTSDRKDIPYKEIVNLFHEHTKSFGIIKKLTAARRNSIKARWNEYREIDSFKKAFINAEASDFLTGRDGEWNNCSFDNLLTPKIFTKCIEGGYAGKKKADKSDKPELPVLAEPEGWRICLEVLCGKGFDGNWQMFCDSQRELALDIIKKLK